MKMILCDLRTVTDALNNFLLVEKNQIHFYRFSKVNYWLIKLTRGNRLMYSDMQYDECFDGDLAISAYLKLSDDIVSDGSYCWDYSFRFENNSDAEITLLSKELSVIDNNGKITSVNYHGFRGQLPQLIPGDDFEDDGYVTAKSTAILKGSCKIKIGNKIRSIDLPVFSLIANDNRNLLLN